jgi:hypothetical protein
MKDLVALVADKNTESALEGLLGRGCDFGMRVVDYDVFVHPRRDPGCFNEAEEFLRPLANAYAHAVVVFDHHGCGQESRRAANVRDLVRARLQRNGWPDTAADVIVIAPELEAWVWSDSPVVEECLGWSGRSPALRQWLASKQLWPLGIAKPPDPKKAVETALRTARIPRSSAVYGDLAQRLHIQGCTDRPFRRLVRTLRTWFPG